MSLPSGYWRLEYIQSSGTQCIDTGVTFEKSDALEYEVVMTVTPPSSGRYFGGGDYTQIGIGTSGYGQYAASNTKAYGEKDTVHVAWNPSTNTETCTVNGEQVFTLNWASVTITNVKVGFFRLGYSNNGWYDSNMTTAALYSGKVWKNGALVREFIPAQNASGVVGLWDDVGGAFYENAGTGVFTAGAEVGGTHRTLIDGTEYEVTGGSAMVDGTVYRLSGGRTLVDGTSYEISFAPEAPSSYMITYSLNSGYNDGSLYVDGTQVAYGTSGSLEISSGSVLKLGYYASIRCTVVVLMDGATVHNQYCASGSSFAYEFTPNANCSISVNYASNGVGYTFTWTITTG